MESKQTFNQGKKPLNDSIFIELANLLPDTVYQTDESGNVTFVNKAGTELFGYQLSDFIDGLKPLQLFVPDDHNRIEQNLQNRLAGVPGLPNEYMALKKNGETFPVIVHTNPIIRNKQCVGIVGLLVDISHLRRLETKLSVSEEKYKDIFENISDYWYFHDLDGNYIETNFAFKKDLNLFEKKISVLNVRDLIPDSYRHQFDDYLKEVKNNKKSEGLMYVQLKEDDIRICEYRNSLVYDKKIPIGVRGAARDITQRKNAEKALKESEERYRSVFENAGVPTVIVEEDRIISKVNEKFEEISGYSKHEVEGKKTFLQFAIKEEHEKMTMFHQAHQEGNSAPSEFECRVIHKNGMVFDVLLRVGMIPNTKQTVASFTDITNRKKEEKALRESQEYLQKENIRLRSSIKERYRFGRIIGKSSSMQNVYNDILKAGATNANVIVYGESGTGKELVAQAIHQLSGRKMKKLITVNCGAIPINLLESEFFGHKKGAFTNASEEKTGYLSYADGGTLFLDEIGEIELSMQVKLLRAIEGGGFTPVGSNQIQYTDARIITATNRNLMDQVKNGQMREDFFYRIHVIPIHLPPLRERKEDLPLLIDHFLKEFDYPSHSIPGKVIEALNAHDWPGNVRELQNVIYRYVTMQQIDFIDLPTDHPEDVRSELPFFEADSQNLQTAIENYEKSFIARALNKHNWQRGKTSSSLGINRKTLFVKMKKYELI